MSELGDIMLRFSNPEVIVGANGSGKSSLFEFLRFLRDACYAEIPSEIVTGSIGQHLFHKPGPDKFGWNAEIAMKSAAHISFQGELIGPIGAAKIAFERVISKAPPLNTEDDKELTLLDFQNGKGTVIEPVTAQYQKHEWDMKKANQLALGAVTDSRLETLFNLKEYVRNWRFYDSFACAHEKIRRPVPPAQHPVLHEDLGNLSAVLFYLMTEERESFDELQTYIRMAIPGFRSLNIKARGGLGEVIACWLEDNIDHELSLADLSDGTLSFISWATLCVLPHPPTLICIDEPEQGVHPRTLPILAGLFEKASDRNLGHCI
jgi:predicted ATPase